MIAQALEEQKDINIASEQGAEEVKRECLSDGYKMRANEYCQQNIGLNMVEDFSRDSDSWH